MALPPDLNYNDALARQTVNQRIPDNNQKLVDPKDVREAMIKSLDTFKDNFEGATTFMKEQADSAAASETTASNAASIATTKKDEILQISTGTFVAAGFYNASTNQITKTDENPAVVSTPSSSSAFAKGTFFDVKVGGTTSVPTGVSELYEVGDKLRSQGIGLPFQLVKAGASGLLKATEVESKVDALSAATTGVVKQDLAIPLSVNRYLANGTASPGQNSTQAENPDRSVVFTGWSDISTTDTLAHMDTLVTAAGLAKIRIDFQISNFRTTSPYFGVGYVSGGQMVIFGWRDTGQLSYFRPGISGGVVQLLAAGAGTAITTSDTAAIEITIGASSVTLSFIRNGIQVYTTPFSLYLPTGNIGVGMRGTVNVTYSVTTTAVGQIAQAVTSANGYTDVKTLDTLNRFNNLALLSAGETLRDLTIPLTLNRYDSNGNAVAGHNSSQTKNADKSVTFAGWSDVSTDSNVTDMATGVTSVGWRKVIVDFVAGAAITSNPCFGVGFVAGAERILIVWRRDGQIIVVKPGTNFFTSPIAADVSRAYTTNDICRLELVFGTSSTTVNLYKGSPRTLLISTTVAFVPTGDFLIGLRGSMNVTYSLVSEKQGTVEKNAKDYTDGRVTPLVATSGNLIPPLFTADSSYSSGSGAIITSATAKRCTNLIAVLPDTEYTLYGVNTIFVGNEYSANSATSGNRVRVIAASVSGNVFKVIRFKTSPTTTYLGINVTSAGLTDASATAVLVQGWVYNYPALTYQSEFIDATKLRGKLPDLVVSYFDVYYEFDADGYTNGDAGATTPTGRFIVYTKIKGSKDFYVGYRLNHVVNSTKIQDIWRVMGGEMYQLVNGVMQATGRDFLSDEEAEAVYLETGSPADFTGGYHGYETLTEVFFYADNVRVNTVSGSPTADIPLTPCKTFKYIQKSNMFLRSDGTTVNAIHVKKTTFEDGSFKPDSMMTFQRVFGVAYAYLGGIFPTHLETSEIVYTEDSDYQTITAASSGGVHRFNAVGLREINYLHQTNRVATVVSSKITRAISGATDNTAAKDAAATLEVWDRNVYAKYYRKFPGSTVAAGEVWRGEGIFTPYKLKSAE